MKKFALGILSLFMILSGVFLSACDKEVSLSVSVQNVTISTNDEQAENYKSKEIDVTLENSSAGIGVNVVSGLDKIDFERNEDGGINFRKKGSNIYSFTVIGSKSGQAELEVYAVEDIKISKKVYVNIDTDLEGLDPKDSQVMQSSLFVVKGTKNKTLNVEDYFELNPITANSNEVEWGFEVAGSTEPQISLDKDGDVYATIIGNQLTVTESCVASEISLRATFVKNKNIYSSIKLAVLENSTINGLTIYGEDKNGEVGNQTLYQNSVIAKESAEVEMKRNDSNRSKATGTLVVNTKYEVSLGLVVFKQEGGAEKQLLRSDDPTVVDGDEVWDDYFSFNILSKVVDDTKTTYQFELDARDFVSNKKFGNFRVYFQVKYDEYEYSIDTSEVDLFLNSQYCANSIELTDEDGNGLNNTVVDVFSNYEDSKGFKISTIVEPDDVALDNNKFYIYIDLNQSQDLQAYSNVNSIAYFYYAGSSLSFTKVEEGTNIWQSQALASGSTVEVVSAGRVDVLENVEFKFVAQSNSLKAQTSIKMNFYQISDDALEVELYDLDDATAELMPEISYMSSIVSEASSTTKEFVLKIKGLSTTSGLQVAYDENDNFKFSEIEDVTPEEIEGEKFVVVKFVVSLQNYNIDDTVRFWFEHVTNKESDKYMLNAFVPIQEAYVQNANKSSVDVFKDETSVQSYVFDEGGTIVSDFSHANQTMSKVMLEAGTSLPISMSAFGASLVPEVGIEFRFLSFEKLITALKVVEGIADDEVAEVRANELFVNNDIDISDYYRFFEVVDAKLLQIYTNSIDLTNNEFKGFVIVLFNGYDEEHEEKTVVRYFALESFYSVRYLSANLEFVPLYTRETLSVADMERSEADIVLTMRPDKNVPTYSNNISYFKFKSENIFEGANEDGYFVASEVGASTSNKFYTISNIVFGKSGQVLEFRIVANSTQLQTSVEDVLRIVYVDENGIEKETNIQILIRNVKRIESVKWLNETQDQEIYLNSATEFEREKNFTISTSVLPSDANDIGLYYQYFARNEIAQDLEIETSSVGQTFNLSIDANVVGAGFGDLYLLPNDMVKLVGGTKMFLFYKYEEDAQGNVVENADYKELSELNLYYEDLMDEGGNISNYFYNSDGKKVYYKDIIIKIKITIADGNSEGAAIRIYNSADFEKIDYAKYYQIMNNITLTNWQTFAKQSFSGMFFGKNENVTINLVSSNTFVDKLSGTIKNLTFTGDVVNNNSAYVGFVANTVESTGLIENVVIDVNSQNGDYLPSTISSSYSSAEMLSNLYMGGVVGYNEGTISGVYTLGLNMGQSGSVSSEYRAYVGGTVGYNSGKIVDSGVEFYQFASTVNKISAKGIVGGLTGFASFSSDIENSYVYAYSLAENPAETVVVGASGIGAFVGHYSNDASSKPTVKNTFAFMGSVKNPVVSLNSDMQITFQNVYQTYFDGEDVYSRIYKSNTFSCTNGVFSSAVTADGLLSESDIPSALQPNGSTKWQNFTNVVSGLDRDIWEVENVNSEINFGFMYLKDKQQSVAINVDNVEIKDNVKPLKSLKVGENKAILFVYQPKATVTGAVEQADLDRYNTINISDLFYNVTAQQARSLLLKTDNTNVVVSTNSLKVVRPTVREFEIEVFSKMDFTKTRTFTFVIVNYIPELQTTIEGAILNEDQTVLLQTGLDNSRSVTYSTNNSVSLAGTVYDLVKDDYDIEFSLSENEVVLEDDSVVNKISVAKSNNSLMLTGETASNDIAKVWSALIVEGLADEYNASIKNIRSRNFEVSVYNGATSLTVDDAKELVVRPNEYAPFDVIMTTDNAGDNIVIGLSYDGVDLVGQQLTDTSVEFVVDNKLVLQMSWSKYVENDGDGNYKYDLYKVIVKIKTENRHLIDKKYENLTISINALSQATNEKYKKYLDLSVDVQKIEGFSMATYDIQNRQVRNSVLYFTPSSDKLNTMSPSTDAIVNVSVSPAFALMTHFTLTYEASGESVGTVSVSKLSKNNYGYYLNSLSTTYLTNGLRVDLTEADKTGDGLYFFRIYVSSAFQSNSDLILRITFYNHSEVLNTATQNIKVDYMAEANVKVNDASTVLVAKGSTAQVTVRTGVDQDLYSLNLQNNKENITLSDYTEKTFEGYKMFYATLSVGIGAKLDGGATSGIFYVNAQVARMKNNVLEIKESSATVCMVDFVVDANRIKVGASNGTVVYEDGNEYDAYYSYKGSKDVLTFDYSISPENYIYDKTNSEEVAAVESILEKRKEFETKNSYKDEEVGYYINHEYNDSNWSYSEITLKEQLWYASSQEESWKIYNEEYDYIIQNDFFSIEEEDASGVSQMVVTGNKTGKQLMKLRTTVIYNGIKFVYDYYFVIVVDIWSDEEAPTQITSGEEFVKFATNSEGQPDDYILMNDIVLSNYTPVDTSLITSLDGNGFTIHLNSFAMPEGETLSLALFSEVMAETTLKNVRVNIYNGGQIEVNIRQYTSQIEIAGFALENNGIIYNCEVVSYYDEDYQYKYTTGDTGLVVKYTEGKNTTPIQVAGGLESVVSGFVVTNNASIINSRVGGESIKHIVTIAGKNYVQTQDLGMFVLEGQGEVSGFVNENTNQGNIAACFVDNVQIYNNMNSTTSRTAGFAILNSKNIQNSYVEGVATLDSNGEYEASNTNSNITAIGIVAGFIYDNAGLVKNAYSNIAIENSVSKPSSVAGFVYQNRVGATVTLCYSACSITKSDINQMQFSGVDENDVSVSLNKGEISFSYFYNYSRVDETNQSKVTAGVLSVTDVKEPDTFYGFTFSSFEGAYDGIWEITEKGLTLVAPNRVALSNRYAVTNGVVTSMFYSKNILDADTMSYVDLSYGSQNNPIIIRDEFEFVKATGKTSKEISAYKEFYNDREVWGNYRIVNDLNFGNLDKKTETEEIFRLSTTTKKFSGMLDGNGFTISNINLGSSVAVENYGIFAKLDQAVVMNLDLIVDSVHNDQANIVGTLAGTAIDSKILSITLTPVSVADDTAFASTSIHGINVVGGVVGMILGESRLHDIKVNDINIYSSYNYGKTKDIDANKDNVGDVLRDYVSNNIQLKSKVERISYAGGIAGYVDIYNTSREDDFTKFSSALEMSDYDVVTVYVKDSVDIRGEIVGGLFGYVGKSTSVYDGKIQLDASGEEGTRESYIISTNLFAGGLVGENYGGLFAVSAEYSETIQTAIEETANAYYRGQNSEKPGQTTIFSYPDQEGGRKENDVKYIGGLIGFMGGGYIYVGYNKLNVVSYSESTVAAGGVVGLVKESGLEYEMISLRDTPKVDVYFNDVYASGDVSIVNENNTTGFSAGLIGALDTETVFAAKNVMAVNHYAINGSALNGNGNNAVLVGTLYSDEGVAGATLEANFFILDSDNGYFNLFNNDITNVSALGSITVGGYKNLVLRNQTTSLDYFGFAYDKVKVEQFLIDADHIGKETMSTMPAAYSKLCDYFLNIGWTVDFWKHQDTLYPEIVLMPVLDIHYWDYDNTEQTLNIMQNSSTTVVVRGKTTDNDGNETYRDIDLTGTLSTEIQSLLPIEGFTGRLISYYAFMKSDVEGVVDIVTRKDGEIVGGQRGDYVGIIMSQPLFKSLDSADIESLNIYVYNDDEGGGEFDFSFVEETANDSLFREVKMVVNSDTYVGSKIVSLSTGIKVQAAGLFTSYASGTSFADNEVVLRNDVLITVKQVIGSESGAAEENIYLGLLAGFVEQTSGVTPVVLEGLKVGAIDGEGEEISGLKYIRFEFVNKDASIGLYTGKATKASGGQKASLSVVCSVLDEVVMEVKTTGGSSLSANIGGFVGELSAADKVSLESAEESIAQGLRIYLLSDFNNLNAGLLFGTVSGSYLNIEGAEGDAQSIKGGIYQANTMATTVSSIVANIGGFAGRVENSVDINSFGLDFSMGQILYSEAANGTRTYAELETVDTTENKYLYELNSFVAGSKGSSIGGLFGILNGDIVVAGKVYLAGTIDVMIEITENEDNLYETSIGGIVGNLVSSFESNAQIENSLNICVAQGGVAGKDLTVNVGGLIGKAQKVEGKEEYKILINAEFENRFVNVSGNVLSNVSNLNFGGAIGFVERVDYDTIIDGGNKSVQIANVIYGGAVKAYGLNLDPKPYITVGGIVGRYALRTAGDANFVVGSEYEGSYTIENCYSYGDVFVLQDQSFQTQLLSGYSFGGIVGAGSKISVENSSSLMTSFNRYLTSDLAQYNVGAIVGENSSAVYYNENLYSSGVNMAYQIETGNTDCKYGASGIYEGYTTAISKDQIEENNFEILTEFRNLFTTAFDQGHKLNPYLLSNSNIDTKLDEASMSTTHNISWVSVDNAISSEEVLADELKNIYIVGNGQVFKRTHTETVDITSATALGGIVNTIGSNTTSQAEIGGVSGLVLDIDANVDINTNNLSLGFYGGVAGRAYNESYIYGVGVKGKISIGGANQQLRLAGIVGYSSGGIINETYSDADLYYRGAEQGKFSVISNYDGAKYSVAKSTYASGLLESYVANIDVSAFAYTTSSATNSPNKLCDVYSIAQTTLNDVLNDSGVELAVSFLKGKFSSFGQVLNGSASAITTGFDYVDIDDMSLEYNDSANIKTVNSISLDGSVDETFSKWYFNPFVNYGYASHGFGYLKNVTSYRRTEIDGSQNPETGLSEYDYTPVLYTEVLEKYDTIGESAGDYWFLGVPNIGKFQQMISTSDSDNYDKNYRFVLRYSFDMSKVTGFSYKTDIGNTGLNFILDGNNNTLSNIENRLFENVVGNIENLRLSTKGSLNVSAVLAQGMQGQLKNITLQGSLDVSGKQLVGGLVADMKGDVVAVDNMADIKVAAGGLEGTVGGIVGTLSGSNGTINYSTNSGLINVSGTNKMTVGGLIGKITQKNTVSYNYNANSVLAGYNGAAANSYYAGGIVGKIDSGAGGTVVSRCYNVGFVGAGSYQSENQAYAAGIAASGDVDYVSCINEGPVEALSKMSDISATLSEARHVSGSAVSGATYYIKVDPLKYAFDLKYTDTPRRVYAYGICAEGGDYDSCFSTTNNIKNDGWIKPENQTTQLEFNRQAVLANDDGALTSIRGMFSVSSGHWVSGYDSYGFPTRVFMQDNLTRTYHDTDFFNETAKLKHENWLSLDFNGNEWISYAGVKDRNGTLSSVSGFNALHYDAHDYGWYVSKIKYVGTSSAELINQAYYLSANSSYFSYGYFKGYEEYLKEENGKLGQNTASQFTYGSVQDYLERIDTAKETKTTDLETITVNGKGVAVVKNGGNIVSVMTPYRYKLSTSIIVNDENVDMSQINEKNITISSTDMAFSTIDSFSILGRRVNVEATLYFGTEKANSIQANVQLDYDVELESIYLQKNNVKIDSGKVAISLEQLAGLNSTYTLNKAELSNTAGTYTDITAVSVLDKSSTPYRLIYSGDTTQNYSDRTLKLTFNTYYNQETNAELEVDIETQSETTIIPENSTATTNVNLKGFASTTKSISFDSLIYAKSLNLKTILNGQYDTISQIVLGSYTLTKEADGSWSVSGSNSDYAVAIDTNGILTITKANGAILSATTVDKDYSAELQGYINSWQPVEGYDLSTYTFENIWANKYNLSNLGISSSKIALGNGNFNLVYQSGGWTVTDSYANYDFIIDNGYLVVSSVTGSWAGFNASDFRNLTTYYNITDIKQSVTVGTMAFNKLVSNTGLGTGLKVWYQQGVNIPNFEIQDISGTKYVVYVGSDFDSESTRIATQYYGTDFYSVNVGVGATDPFKLAAINGGGSQVEISDGTNTFSVYMIPSNEGVVLPDWVSAGNSIKISREYVTFTRADADLYVSSSSISFYNYDEDGKQNASYNASKTSAQQYVDGAFVNSCPHCGGEDCTILTTTKLVNGAKESQVSIFSCGVVEVTYFDEDDKTEATLFVFKTSDSGYYGYKKYSLFIDDDLSDGEDNSLSTDLGAFSGTSYMYSYDGIEIDYIVNDFIPADHDANGNITSEAYVSFGYIRDKDADLKIEGIYKENVDTIEDRSLTLIQGMAESFSISQPSGYVSNTFEKNVNDAGWETATFGTFYAPADYSSEEYAFRYSGQVGSSANAIKEDSSEAVNIDYILFADDISLGLKNFAGISNDKDFVGNNYSLRYWESILFNKNLKTIKDLTIVSSSIDNSSLFINTNDGVLKNLKIAGGIRNIWAGSTTTRHTIITANNKDVINLTSNVFLYGADSEFNNVNVNATLSNNAISASAGVFNDILIAGDGYTQEQKYNISGRDGTNGTNGGSIDTASGKYLIAIAGLGGRGSNGSDGKNGSFNGSYATGGQGGGTAGSNGANGNVAGTEVTFASKGRSDYKTLYSGNGGLGGLGRIANGFYYTSGASGNAGGGDGSNGKSYTLKASSASGKGSAYFGTSSISVASSSDSYFGVQASSWGALDRWKENVDNAWTTIPASQHSSVSSDYDGSTYGKALENPTSKMYLKVQAYSLAVATGWPIKVGAYWTIDTYKLSWTSGEAINSTGRPGYVYETYVA